MVIKLTVQRYASYHIEAETTYPPFSIHHFQMHFVECKCINFDSDFTEVSSQWSNQQYSSIESYNGLTPLRREAIMWINDGLICWRIIASLGLNELNFLLHKLLTCWNNLSENKYNLYEFHVYSWWRHQTETFSVLLALCAGNSQATGEFPSQRPVTRSFDVRFNLHLNKRLSK